MGEPLITQPQFTFFYTNEPLTSVKMTLQKLNYLPFCISQNPMCITKH